MPHAIVSREEASRVHTVAPGVAGLRTVMVNLYYVGPREGPWLLVDTGIPGTAGRIRRAAEVRFGHRARPEAILLTHGHFDHVGTVKELAEEWDVPVYAHPLEMPYLTGKSEYPPPDPTVGGGALAFLSPLFPRGPIDLDGRLRELPSDGSVPGFDEWQWIHTPGHSPGHVSLYREKDRALIAGDAFVTTKQASLSAVMTQRVEMHGPPAYFTSDWDAARDSVERLSRLRPNVMATGHGLPLAGKRALDELERIAQQFDVVERPAHGRYAARPAISGPEGVISVPPAVPNPALRNAVGLAAGLLLAATVVSMARRERA